MNKIELKEELKKLLKNKFKLRMKLNSGELQKTHLLKKVRRDIARVMYKLGKGFNE